MSFLKPATDDVAYLKAGFLGFNKSGKTYTSALLLCAAYNKFGGKGGIAFFDTEGGSTYIKSMVKTLTGQDILVCRSRSFADLMGVAAEVQKQGIKFLLVDSITHPWRELCDAALKEINEARKQRRLSTRQKLEFQDWAVVKAKWSEWTEFYLNSDVHIIIAGRAGFEYDFVKNEETGRKDLEKTGIKMKTESEFGFEPSLLVYMETDQVSAEDPTLVRSATVMGDRFNLLDGATFKFSTVRDVKKAMENVAKFFDPHLSLLCPTTTTGNKIDTSVKTELGLDAFGNDDSRRRSITREATVEAIDVELKRAYPGQNNDSKIKRADLAKEIWPDVKGWAEIEGLVSLEKLTEGLEHLKVRVAEILEG